MSCCGCATLAGQTIDQRIGVAPSSPLPVYHTDRQYIGGASGFDSPFNAPEIPLYPVRVITQRQANPPFLLIALLVAGIAYLYFMKKGA